MGCCTCTLLVRGDQAKELALQKEVLLQGGFVQVHGSNPVIRLIADEEAGEQPLLICRLGSLKLLSSTHSL